MSQRRRYVGSVVAVEHFDVVPQKERSGRTAPRSDEYTKLLSLAGGHPRDYAILQVFLQTGVSADRHSGERALCPDPFRYRLRRATGTDRQREGSEGTDDRAGEKGIQAIKSYLAVRPESLNEALFLNYQGEPLSDRGVRKMFAKYLKASGITKKISPHTLRHAFATHKAERGVSPYVLREWLGHARLDTTQIYVHMARENTKKAMEATSL